MSLVAQKRMKEAANAALSVKTFMFPSLPCRVLQLKRPFSIWETQTSSPVTNSPAGLDAPFVWENIKSGPDVCLDQTQNSSRGVGRTSSSAVGQEKDRLMLCFSYLSRNRGAGL